MITGALGGLKQVSIRKLLAFSSNNHLGWMLEAILFIEYLWLFYFLVNSFISFNLIKLFILFNI